MSPRLRVTRASLRIAQTENARPGNGLSRPKCSAFVEAKEPEISDGAAILIEMPLISRIRSGRVRRLEEQMRAMDSKIDAMVETFESRRADDEAAAIAAERIRSGAADRKEDGAEALASLGIKLPEG